MRRTHVLRGCGAFIAHQHPKPADPARPVGLLQGRPGRWLQSKVRPALKGLVEAGFDVMCMVSWRKKGWC